MFGCFCLDKTAIKPGLSQTAVGPAVAKHGLAGCHNDCAGNCRIWAFSNLAASALIKRPLGLALIKRPWLRPAADKLIARDNVKFASRGSNLDVWPGARSTACPLCFPWGASVRLPGVDRQQLVFPVADAGLSLQLGYCTTARKVQGDEFPFTSSIWTRPLAGRSRQSRSKKKSVAARRSDTTNASAYSTDSKKIVAAQRSRAPLSLLGDRSCELPSP